MKKMLIKGALVVNEGKTQTLDVRIENGKITSLQPDITQVDGEEVVMAQGKYLLPRISIALFGMVYYFKMNLIPMPIAQMN